MYSILVAIYLLFTFLILKNKGEKRLIYLILGVFMLPGNINIIPNSMLMGYTLYATAFTISMIYHKELYLTFFPFKKQLALVFISCILIGLFDERLGPLFGMWRGFQYFFTTFFLFVFGWCSLSNNITKQQRTEENNDNVFSHILPYTLIITIYGLITGVTKTNPILDAVGLEDRFFFEYDESYRSFRVTGANISSSVYGISCAILFLCCCFLTTLRNKIRYTALGLLFINCFLSATRAAMIPFLIALLFFLIIKQGFTKTFKYLSIALISIFLLFPILPNGITNYFTELTDSIVDVVLPSRTGGGKYVGSTVEGRTMQITTAMSYLMEKPFFGHGFAYANEVILKGEKDSELLGMESYLCFIGIEFGLVYAATIIFFFTSTLVYFIKNKNYSAQYAYMGISIIIMYIFYLIYAWVGASWYFIMPILGYITKKIYLTKQSSLRHNHN